ncbi:uncharacterized, partial [Tachysurus ichikawai]
QVQKYDVGQTTTQSPSTINTTVSEQLGLRPAAFHPGDGRAITCYRSCTHLSRYSRDHAANALPARLLHFLEVQISCGPSDAALAQTDSWRQKAREGEGMNERMCCGSPSFLSPDS